ncbi:unnamed protein product [Schistosoma curassoni]|uniref:Uncharacterized protein n=1 Tax=Schistosoma curassoni TaxID=6186 RepID=A0A183KQT9_9TREM|nr:unnamed protein product [Schistosoma curassoni]
MMQSIQYFINFRAALVFSKLRFYQGFQSSSFHSSINRFFLMPKFRSFIQISNTVTC